MTYFPDYHDPGEGCPNCDIYFDAHEEEPSRRREKPSWRQVAGNTVLWCGLFFGLLIFLAWLP